MQRTRKTPETRISEYEAKKAQYQAKIDNYKAKISAIDSQIQKLKDAKEKNLQSLLKVIRESGKTPEEVMSELKGKE